MNSKLPDSILYVVYSQPGGVDDRDPSDKGNELVAAAFVPAEIERYKADARYRVERRIVDADVVNAILEKLDPIECFLLKHHFQGQNKGPVYRGG